MFIYHADNKDSLEDCLHQIKNVVSCMVNDGISKSISLNDSKHAAEGEKNIISRLIVLDDMSCITDKSQPLANFITSSGILEFCVVTIFDDINSTTGVWFLLNSTTT